MIVNVIGEQISDEEKEAYVKRAKEKYPNDNIESITVEVDGDFVNLTYHKQPIPFSRIRRIIGYFTNMNRVNDAKRSEISDRVKHI